MHWDSQDGSWRDPDADVTFEISSLDEPEDATSVSSLPIMGASESNASESNASESYASDTAAPAEAVRDDTDLPLDTRVSPRRRVLAAATSAAVVALAVVLLLVVPVGGSPLVQDLFPGPAPTAPVAPGDGPVILENAVPWGALRLDGRQIAMPTADPLAREPYSSLQLSRGRHTIDFTAAPFPPRHCVVSVPAAAEDTCGGIANVTINGAPLRAVDLQATPTNLPPDQSAALAAVVQAALVFPPADLPPGDHYARSDGRFATATGAWKATLLATLNPQGSGATGVNVDGQSCESLCSGGLFGPPPAQLISVSMNPLRIPAVNGRGTATRPEGRLTATIQWKAV